jgi:hypothetical protein
MTSVPLQIRGSAATTQGRKRCEDILLHHQLWLADSSKYEDPQDNQVEYRVSISGDGLFRELVAYTRRTAIVSRFKAERMVSELVAKDPTALQGMLKANARGPRLWAEYGENHTGCASSSTQRKTSGHSSICKKSTTRMRSASSKTASTATKSEIGGSTC